MARICLQDATIALLIFFFRVHIFFLFFLLLYILCIMAWSTQIQSHVWTINATSIVGWKKIKNKIKPPYLQFEANSATHTHTCTSQCSSLVCNNEFFPAIVIGDYKQINNATHWTIKKKQIFSFSVLILYICRSVAKRAKRMCQHSAHSDLNCFRNEIHLFINHFWLHFYF